MSRDEDDKKPSVFDVRTIDRNIRKGLTTRKDYDKHLKTLPDVSDKIAPPEALRPISALSSSLEPDDDLDDLDDDTDTEEITVDTAAAAAADEGADEDDLDDEDLDDEDEDDDADADDKIGPGGGTPPPPA